MSNKKCLRDPSLQESVITGNARSLFYTDIENVFTTPTTASEASDDEKEIELEEDLLTYCSDKEKFLSVVYYLKDKRIDILLPYLKLLSFLVEKNNNDPTEQYEEQTIHTPTESGASKPSVILDFSTPKYIDWDFVGSSDGLSMEPGCTDKEEEEEKILIEDVLNILLGYDGKYIKANLLKDSNSKRTFRISSHIRTCRRGLVERVLPLASDYSTVVRFVHENTAFAAGNVNQALAASFSFEVIQYSNSVLGLESLKDTKNVNLHLVWCVLQEAMNKMRIMSKITEYINKENARGASTLNILHRCTSNSLADPEAEKICLRLTKAACAPYFSMLENWLYRGQIDDRFDEFMIVDKGRGNYEWDQKFELKVKNVPTFLKQEDKLILNTGRYMYAVRQSISIMEEMPCAETEFIQYEIIDIVYLNMIKRSYNFANETLMSIMDSSNTISWLRTAKSFYSLEYDDAFHSIIQNCSIELAKHSASIFLPYLQRIVDASIRTSSLSKIEFSSEFKVKLEKCSLIRQINSLNIHVVKELSENQSGLEAITFITTPPWPVCIIFHSKTMTAYQMLFRHIFYLKYVYLKLTSTRLDGRPKPLHLLRYSMTVFVQSCLSYMTVETIETLWDKFESECRNVYSVIDLIQLHNNYIYQALRGCMLASCDVFRRLRKAVGICLNFCSQLTMELESDFRNSLVALIKVASKESYWSPFIKALIPTFTDISEVVELNKLCQY